MPLGCDVANVGDVTMQRARAGRGRDGPFGFVINLSSPGFADSNTHVIE
jgi:hypothetical protein